MTYRSAWARYAWNPIRPIATHFFGAARVNDPLDADEELLKLPELHAPSPSWTPRARGTSRA
jgi:hypothetical protein